MTDALVPGSFDPPTNGHLDIIERCAAIFDRVVVAVVVNPSKQSTFDAGERVAMLEGLCSHLDVVEVEAFEGLLVDFAVSKDVHVVVKGLRGMSDFDYEVQMAQMNHRIARVDTMFMATSPGLGFLSSSLVKEVARLGGDVTDLVPPTVAEALKERL